MHSSTSTTTANAKLRIWQLQVIVLYPREPVTPNRAEAVTATGCTSVSLSFLAMSIRGKMLLLDRLPLGDSLPNPPLYVLTEFSRISEEIKSMVLKGSQTDASEGSGCLWSFAGRAFDESRLELRVNGKPVELELKPLEILVQLLLHAGEVVTKDELLDAVWPGLTVVEGSLSTAIYKLRKALGDEESTIVVTVPRVGYRLGASVQSQAIRASPLAAELGLKADEAVPGREHWCLVRALDVSAGSEVWLARHPKTRELRVFKFASNAVRLKGLKREVTVSRFLRESLGERPELVRVLEWNFDAHPYFLESEYGVQTSRSGPRAREDWPGFRCGFGWTCSPMSPER